MWSALDRSYRLSYRGVGDEDSLTVDFVGDENNPNHSHYKELTIVENSWLRVIGRLN